MIVDNANIESKPVRVRTNAKSLNWRVSRSCDRPSTISTIAFEFNIDVERENDDRWLAKIPELPGVSAYGTSVGNARADVEALMRRVLAECHEFEET
jgi:predicted RNase H-like HicB family nuclease